MQLVQSSWTINPELLVPIQILETEENMTQPVAEDRLDGFDLPGSIADVFLMCTSVRTTLWTCL